jgi:hypothetical protein
MSAHCCHANGCPGEALPGLPFCPRHWGRCPAPLQFDVWRLWYPAHALAGRLSTASAEVLERAIAAVAEGTP